MKLFFDANLSPKLVSELNSEYPGSAHASHAGLRGADDHQIWDHARTHGFAIVSKDTDFRERSLVEGFPPKIIWLDVGNAGTALITDLLQSQRHRIERFDTDAESSLLILSIGANAV